MYIRLHVKCLLFLSDFHETGIFLTDVQKILKIPNFMKIRPVRTELFHLDERTERHDEANSCFSQFCELSQKLIQNLITVQQDATYSVYYISVGSSTCFGCRHPSSRARTTVITASGID